MKFPELNKIYKGRNNFCFLVLVLYMYIGVLYIYMSYTVFLCCGQLIVRSIEKQYKLICFKGPYLMRISIVLYLINF